MKRSVAHLVEDARLREDEVWVRCTCGEFVTADRSEAANEAFQRHRLGGGDRRGEASVRHDGVHGQSWRKGGNAIFATERAEQMREAARRYRAEHPDRVREASARYRARLRDERAA